MKLTDNGFPVVGIGASAGGLDALQTFFANVPSDTGLAFIVVTHQQPDHVSLLPELLGHFTQMTIVSAEDGSVIKKNHVYVCPPGKNFAVFNHKLHLMEPGKYDSANLPVDYFLRSLAESCQHQSIGIILSGTGTDGTLGLKSIKSVSGLTIAQEPKSAKFDGMPTSAIAMGDVDFVLPAEKMGQQLLDYCKGLSAFKTGPAEPDSEIETGALQKIFILLRNRTGNDFSLYKHSTIKRRIGRRMASHQINNPDKYVLFLQDNPIEIDKLSKELLINVTNFFRDSDAFKALSEKTLPFLFEGKPENYQFRIWVTGCASGEEAYSIAILFKEAIEKTGKSYGYQVFATDLDETSINRARDGIYLAGIAADMTHERLVRFFHAENNQYRICKEIRESVVFVIQNLIQDPPFTRIDLISCRNLLIYINLELQKEILPQLQYALNPGGILFLGSSESIGHSDDRFSVLDKKWKIYQRKDSEASYSFSRFSSLPIRNGTAAVSFNSLNGDLQTGYCQADRAIITGAFCAGRIITNDTGKIVYIHGRTGNYLEPVSGQPNWNVVDMAREGLRMPLMTMFRKIVKGHDNELFSNDLKVKTNGDYEAVNMSLNRIEEPEALRNLYLLSIRPQQSRDIEHKVPPARSNKSRKMVDNHQFNEQLEQELLFMKESLLITIEELQASNEEIKSSNEELQSTNEELQSSNEELETSKEEMQSLNEELNTVNNELQNKIEKLSEINDDMQNLLNSTDIATIFLDSQLRIKWLTRQAKNIFKRIDTDIGRPLADQVSILKYDNLIEDAQSVLQTLILKDTEVQTQQNDWYLFRILPYRTSENMVDGLVLTFVDISKLKKAEQTAKAADIATAIVNTIKQPLMVLDEQFQILTSNQAYNQMFNHTLEPLTGQSLFSIHSSAWNSERLRGQLVKTLASTEAFDEFDCETTFPGVGTKSLILNGRILKQTKDCPTLMLLAIEGARASKDAYVTHDPGRNQSRQSILTGPLLPILVVLTEEGQLA